MSSDQANQLFWLNYAQAIKEKASITLGASEAFFVGSKTQEGPVAGQGIPQEYTNQAVYKIANNLLASDDLFYNPSAPHGYFQALRLFLAWIDLGASPSPGLELHLTSALSTLQAAQTTFDTQEALALTQFTKLATAGLIKKTDFHHWVEKGYVPGYLAACNQLSVAGAVIAQIQANIGGPNAELISQARARLGMDVVFEFASGGHGMHAAIGDVLSTIKLLREQSSSQPIPEPTTYIVPAYNAEPYKAPAQGSQTTSGGTYSPQDFIQFSIDTKVDASSFNFGQTVGGAGVSSSYGWLSFNAPGSGSESTIFETGSDASSVGIKLMFDNIETVNMESMPWNPNVSKLKLRNDAPDELKSLARPSQMVVASRLGYEITFNSNLTGSFDNLYKQTVSAGGSVSIFGLSVSLGPEASKNTHQISWDLPSQTLKVQPTDNLQTETVLGIVGEKLNV